MPRNPHPERHVIVAEWADIDAAPAATDRDKQRIATIFSEQAWEHVVWLPNWVLDDPDKDIETVESSEHLAVGRVEDYSEEAWEFVQPHRAGDPGGYLPKSAVVVFERPRGVETIETPQQGLDAFAVEERKFFGGNAPAAGYHEHSNEVVSVQTRGETYWFDQDSLRVFRDRLDRLVLERDVTASERSSTQSQQDSPVTLDLRVRVTHYNAELAKAIVTGNALDDPIGHVTIEETLGEVDPDAE